MSQPRWTPAQFVEKWKPIDLPERAASQEHFIDLCRVPGRAVLVAYAANRPLAAHRAEIDQKVLANLLRLNGSRAAKRGDSES